MRINPRTNSFPYICNCIFFYALPQICLHTPIGLAVVYIPRWAPLAYFAPFISSFPKYRTGLECGGDAVAIQAAKWPIEHTALCDPVENLAAAAMAIIDTGRAVITGVARFQIPDFVV